MKNILSESGQQFEEGKWYPENKGFYHICPQCGRNFFGRKNQIYCPGGQCKGIFNRSKNEYLDLLGVEVLKKMKKNRMTLYWLRKFRKQLGITDKEMLLTSGFDFQAASVRLTTKYGAVIDVYLDYGLSMDPNGKTAYIFMVLSAGLYHCHSPE